MTVLAAVPIKSFASAKNRLASHLSMPQRRLLAQLLSERVFKALSGAGAEPLALAADEDVASWAQEKGYRVQLDSQADLNAAATSAIEIASREGRSWLIVHSDLPHVDHRAIEIAIGAIDSGRPVIVPSQDGGTPALGWHREQFPFAYGPASFQRHLRHVAQDQPLVLTDPRLMFDVDRPADLALVLASDSGLNTRLSTLVGS
ncbi:MAG TPA: 2-phospho-L-lactate guanylyltransferase [Acidimicrobiia bacterium]|nr:2-phospho-L-lactate guanylyltransferase [Acidimicrobiia bacterium]